MVTLKEMQLSVVLLKDIPDQFGLFSNVENV